MNAPELTHDEGMAHQYYHELRKALAGVRMLLASLELTQVGQTVAFMSAEDSIDAFDRRMKQAIREGTCPREATARFAREDQ